MILLSILDHWEMRSIRNVIGQMKQTVVNFRSLGNALYPELTQAALVNSLNFRSLGNALYPERASRFL